MTEKQIIIAHRKMKLEFWLNRQPFNAKFNSLLEAAQAFEKRLDKWAESKESEIVPSFHLAQGI